MSDFGKERDVASDDDVFERNLERLIKRGALPPGNPAARRAEFLRRVGDSGEMPVTAPDNGRRRITMMAAAALIGAVGVWLAVSGEKPVPPNKTVETEPVRESQGSAAPVRERARPPVTAVVRESVPEVESPVLPEGVPHELQARATTRKLEIRGRMPFPEKTVFTVALFRLQETVSDGRLVQSERFWTSQRTWVTSGRIRFVHPTKGPATYRVKLKQANQEVWSSDLIVADPAQPEKLRRGLDEVAILAQRSYQIVRECEGACISEKDWRARGKRLLARVDRLRKELSKTAAKSPYPVSLGQVRSAITAIKNAALDFKWKDGKFDPSTYYTDAGVEELFSFGPLRTLLEKAIPLAGRELSLSAVKDLRQSGRLRPEIAETLRLHEDRPGVRDYVKRLTSAGADELDALEREIREGR